MSNVDNLHLLEAKKNFKLLEEAKNQVSLEKDLIEINPVNENEILSLDHSSETEDVAISRLRHFISTKFFVDPMYGFENPNPFNFRLMSHEQLKILLFGKERIPNSLNIFPILMQVLQNSNAMWAGGSLSRISSKTSIEDTDYDLFFYEDEEIIKGMKTLYSLIHQLNQLEIKYWNAPIFPVSVSGKDIPPSLGSHDGTIRFGLEVVRVTSTAITIQIMTNTFKQKPVILQFITGVHNEASFEEILSMFDLKSSMIGFTKDKILYHKDFSEVIEKREMVFTRISGNHPQAFAKRFSKHVDRQMTLPEKDKNQIYEFVVKNMTTDKIKKEFEHSKNSYDGSQLNSRLEHILLYFLIDYAIATGDDDQALAGLCMISSDPTILRYSIENFVSIVQARRQELKKNDDKSSIYQRWIKNFVSKLGPVTASEEAHMTQLQPQLQPLKFWSQ